MCYRKISSMILMFIFKRRVISTKKIQKQHEEDFNNFRNDQFYYIVGYTSGGVPYGVTWKEMGLPL